MFQNKMEGAKSRKGKKCQYHNQDLLDRQHRHGHPPPLVQQVPMLYRPDHSLSRGLLIPVG